MLFNIYLTTFPHNGRTFAPSKANDSRKASALNKDNIIRITPHPRAGSRSTKKNKQKRVLTKVRKEKDYDTHLFYCIRNCSNCSNR